MSSPKVRSTRTRCGASSCAPWLAFVVVVVVAPQVAAQSLGTRDGWVVVPVVVGGVTSEGVDAWRADLATEGDVLSASDAATRFETAHSATAHSIQPSEIDAWAARSRTALRYLSRGDYSAARAALLEAQGLSERAAEALNRETARARHVLDTCLFVARASLETGDRAAAEEQARRCRRLVPRMQATPTTHPPEVRELLAKVDAELTAENAGTLHVTSAPSGCSVRVNGVYFGTTPLSTQELGRGSYRVQVECDDATEGRVHTIDLSNADARLDVDIAFEAALRSSPTLSLAYSDLGAVDARLARDAAVIARALGRVVLAVVPDGTSVRLVRVDETGVTGTARIDESATPNERVSTLASLRRSDGGVASRRDLDASDRTTRVGFGAGKRTRRIVGASLLGAGLASSASALSLLFVRNHRADVYASESIGNAGYLDVAASYDRARAGVYASALLGAALSTAGVVVATPGRRVPWYGYTLGGFGLGLVAVAITDVATAPHCGTAVEDRPTCLARDRAFARAAFLGTLASPLVAVPFAQLGHAKASVAADRTSVFVSIRSSF